MFGSWRKIARSPSIRKAYELYATRKYSLFDIGQFFYENGIKNKLTGGPPNDSNLRRILMRPLYYGAMVFKGELYEGIHDPIVSKTLFDQVQKVIKQRGWHHKPAKRYDFPFTGFIKCGYCGCSITAEHRPFYFPRTHNKVTYIYYHCTKKRLPCLQKGYTREEVLEKQFREIIQSVSLSQTWADKMLELLENDAKTEKQQAKQELEKLNLELTEIEQKLDRLLEAYLDTLIDGENYKQKKNELMEKQSILKDKISQLKAGNLFWVESVKEFINCAQECAKIARAENNGHLLSQMAKKVGSKYFLKDHRIEFSLWPPYKALAASAGAASATELSDRILNNGKMKGKRWLLLLDREIVFNHTSPQKESVDAFISSLPFDANELVFKTVNNGGVWATFATNKNFYLDVSAAIKKAGGSVFVVVPQDVTSFEKESKVDLPGLLKDSGTYRSFDFLHYVVQGQIRFNYIAIGSKIYCPVDIFFLA